MAEKVPQNLSNHTRFDPLFHFFILPVFFITFISTIVHLVRHPGLHSAWLVVFMLAAALAVTRMRTYAIKVQDRVIRLEERLRLAILLDGPLRSRITEFSESQLVGLRFAFTLVLQPGELLTAIRIPATWAGAPFYFEKVRERLVWDFPMVNVAAAMKVSNGTIESSRIVVNAVARAQRFHFAL